MLTGELDNPIPLTHNDPFPVTNVSHWVTADLTYILSLNYIMNRPEQHRATTACQHRHYWLGHLHWHGSNSLLLTGGPSSHSGRRAVGKVSCHSSSYVPPNCCPMPGLEMGKLPRLNVRVSFLKMIVCAPCLPPLLSHTAWRPPGIVGAAKAMSSHSEGRREKKPKYH